jgi:hypothetical protein
MLSMDSDWSPSITFKLIEILRNDGLEELPIGSPEITIKNIMGEPEVPRAKLNKKSKVYCHLYGNVTFLTEYDKLIAIDIDLHGNRSNTVDIGDISSWNMEDWMLFAENNNWSILRCDDIILLSGKHIKASISTEGAIRMLSIR